MRRFLLGALSALVLAAMVGCGGGDDTKKPADDGKDTTTSQAPAAMVAELS